MALSREDEALRSELVEARFAIQHQLELLQSPLYLRGGQRGGREIVATLRQQLAEIEQALADLEG